MTKLLSKQAKLPTRANKGDAGCDLYLTTDVRLLENQVTMVDLEIAIAIPEGCVGLVFNRSSNAKKHIGLANSVGVIDSGYRGPIKLPMVYTPNIDMPVSVTLNEGDRVAQIVVLPIFLPEIIETEDLPPSTDGRDVGGFGSTGTRD